MLDDFCFRAKNLYNYALYTQRQVYFQVQNRIMSYENLYELVMNSDAYKEMPRASIGQSVIRQVASDFRSFYKSTKAYYKDPFKFQEKPKLPKYKDKNKGRCVLVLNNQAVSILNGKVQFPKVFNGFTVKTKVTGTEEKLKEARVVPKNGIYIVEVVYQKEINAVNKVSKLGLKYVAGIDVGIDNFSTISVWNKESKPIIINGKGLKSYNKYFNKKLAHLKSEAMKKNKMYSTKRIQRLYQKRNNYMQDFMHKASKLTVDYLLANKVRYLVIGNNKEWKQNCNLGKKTNQTFVQIPFLSYIEKLTYKAEEVGIVVKTTEESYTSGTSFLDDELPCKENYNKSRRKPWHYLPAIQVGK